MMQRVLRIAAALAAAATAAGCSNTNSPSSPSGGTSSVTAPQPVQPSTTASIRFGDQPVTLVVRNAATTSTAPAIYTFEVATDASFSSKVQTKDGVAEGANGQTSIKLDTLTGGKDYYWRARATGGGTSGPFGPTSRFSVGAAVILNPPTPIGPLSGTTTTPRPALRAANATRSGPAGTITYLFEISTSSSFAAIVASATKSEGINETGFIPPSDLAVSTTFYWRVTAIDASNGVSSAPSAVQSFTTRPYTQAEFVALQIGVPLWPGDAPTGDTGHATMGNDLAFGVGWSVQTLHYGPGNVDFQCPDIEMVRFFDLFDRGFDPESAISWMNAHGYPTNAQWYPGPEKAVLGLHYVYIAARGKVITNATWDIVLRYE